MVRHAREAGEFYNFRVPLDADYKIGRSWAGEAVDGKTGAPQPAPTRPKESPSDPVADSPDPIRDGAEPIGIAAQSGIRTGLDEINARLIGLGMERRATADYGRRDRSAQCHARC
jgi:hypothetical protein